MQGRTHVLGGLAAAGLALSLGLGHPVTLVLAGGFGGLLPDWDHPHSTLGRFIPWPAVSHSRGPHAPPAVGRAGFPHPIWHRHQAHSLIGMTATVGVFTGLAVVLWQILGAHIPGLAAHVACPWLWIALGLWLGSLSHLVLDGFNQERQWWLWPFSRQGFRWPVHAPVQRIDGLVSLGLTVVVVLLAWHLRVWALHSPLFSL